MNEFPMSAAVWSTGLSMEDYVAGMQRHQEATRRRLGQTALRSEDREAFSQPQQARHALVMTEDWCGDSMLNVPILARIVEAAPGMDLRIFRRGESPELEAYYQARDITHIPVLTFLDADFNPLATWVERPAAAHARLAAWNAAHPQVGAIRANPDLDPDERRRQLQTLTAGLLVEMEGWYDNGLQQATVDEIRQLLHKQAAPV